jgi:hypothetical protein
LPNSAFCPYSVRFAQCTSISLDVTDGFVFIMELLCVSYDIRTEFRTLIIPKTFVPRVSRSSGEIFRTRPGRPWGPPSLLYNGYRVSFPEVKWGVEHPPSSWAEIKESVELYLYSPSGPSRPVSRQKLCIMFTPHACYVTCSFLPTSIECVRWKLRPSTRSLLQSHYTRDATPTSRSKNIFSRHRCAFISSWLRSDWLVRDSRQKHQSHGLRSANEMHCK